MTYQYASDLHLEYKNHGSLSAEALVQPGADVRILAGDIGSLYYEDQLRAFLEKVAQSFVYVLYVAGNHEFYTVSDRPVVPLAELHRRLHQFEKDIPNVYILDRRLISIGGRYFAGCTLWSDPQLWRIPERIVRIPEFALTQTYGAAFRADVAFLEQTYQYLRDKGETAVVITHHCPSYHLLHRTPLESARFRSLYASNLDYLLRERIFHSWIAGHLHINFDTVVFRGGTRLLSNQRGKPYDRITDFRSCRRLELPDGGLERRGFRGFGCRT